MYVPYVLWYQVLLEKLFLIIVYVLMVTMIQGLSFVLPVKPHVLLVVMELVV